MRLLLALVLALGEVFFLGEGAAEPGIQRWSPWVPTQDQRATHVLLLRPPHGEVLFLGPVRTPDPGIQRRSPRVSTQDERAAHVLFLRLAHVLLLRLAHLLLFRVLLLRLTYGRPTKC